MVFLYNCSQHGANHVWPLLEYATEEKNSNKKKNSLFPGDSFVWPNIIEMSWCISTSVEWATDDIHLLSHKEVFRFQSILVYFQSFSGFVFTGRWTDFNQHRSQRCFPSGPISGNRRDFPISAVAFLERCGKLKIEFSSSSIVRTHSINKNNITLELNWRFPNIWSDFWPSKCHTLKGKRLML